MSKTWIKPVTVYHTITAAEQAASVAQIGVYSGQLPTDDAEFTFQVQRAGVVQSDAQLVYSTASGHLGLNANGSYSVTEGDKLVAYITYV